MASVKNVKRTTAWCSNYQMEVGILSNYELLKLALHVTERIVNVQKVQVRLGVTFTRNCVIWTKIQTPSCAN